MRYWFQRLSFRKKILSSYIIFVGISCILVGIYCIKSMDTARTESFRYMHQFGEQVSLNTDVIFSNMDRIRFLHLIDDRVKPVIRISESQKSTTQILEDEDYIVRAINHMTNMNQYILRATIINEYGDVYSNVKTENESYLKRIRSLEDAQDWTDKHKVYYTGVSMEHINMVPYSIVTSVSKIYDIDQDECIGSLYIDLNFAAVQDILDQTMKMSQTGTGLAVIGQEGEVLYQTSEKGKGFPDGTGKEQLGLEELLIHQGEGSPSESMTIQEKKSLAAFAENETTGWTVAVYTPLESIYASGWKNMLGILTSMLVLLAVSILLGVVVAGQISRPVSVLANAMAKVDKGKVNLIDEKEYLWQDEMGQLLHSYNEMGRRINDSIEKIYIHQLNQKQTELKMLQFQINPHFLYNTLNTISSIAALEDIDEIALISDNLSCMFRYNIKGSDTVPMSQEILQVKRYLQIQEIRFPGKYEFTFEISREAEKREMLKFLIQPLVENSLQHAFTKMKEKNVISLSAVVKEDKKILISLFDNGVGIEQEEAERLNRELKNMDSRTLISNADWGIGLRNVNARIKNFYGSEYGIRVESEPGAYTRILIMIGETKDKPGGAGIVPEGGKG